MKTRILLCVGLVTGIVQLTRADTPAPGGTLKDLHILGQVTAQGGELVVASKSATLVIGTAGATTYRMTADPVLAPKGLPVVIQVMPAEMADLKKRAAARVALARDAAGRILTATSFSYDDQGKQPWVSNKDTLNYVYWPTANSKDVIKGLADSGIPPSTWHGRRLRLQVEADRHKIAVWFEGLLLREFDRPDGVHGPVALQLAEGDRLCSAMTSALVQHPLYFPIDITAQANDRFEQPIGKALVQDGAVPFHMPQGARDHISLRKAGWPEAARDPASYYEHYDGGPAMLHDPRMPLLRVPLADYVAAHVLAVADDDPKFTPAFTVQAGRYGFSQQVVQYDFFGQVPRRGQGTDLGSAHPVPTAGGTLFHARPSSGYQPIRGRLYNARTETVPNSEDSPHADLLCD